MADDVALSLHKSIVSALKADLGVDTLINDRIYDRVPPDPTMPYVSIGPTQVLSDDADCLDGFEIFQQIDVWSRDVGQPTAKNIAGAIRKAIHGIELPFDGLFNLVEIRHQDTRHIYDSDGLTVHAALSFRALVDPV